ncbi:ABC transporter permease [Streptomyces tubercidicus]|uniref:ABC transporter n=1 Tax=Streptomyces tubercidicus TaxID=47759 RepID=A0A640USP3_9ACTN|nr:FtsX-like permease family protein [Streptomyces tubercidicus]WAU13238.1 FtsX-like permease family protein [Streptomyces tubercidicus]GFE38809.1 ABC transporter [Streptomyces tubercidicus]
MLRTALRNVLAHKARLIMTALAVLLGVAFVSGTLVFGDTTANAFRKAAVASLKGVAVSVQSLDAGGGERAAGLDGPATPGAKPASALDTALVHKIGALPGVAAVRPTVDGRATVAGKDGLPVNTDKGRPSLATNYLPGKDSRTSLKEGRGPAAEGELALDAQTAEKGGYRIGDNVRFAIDGPALTKKLVGIVTTDDPRVNAGASLTLFDTGTAQKLFLRPGQFHEIAVVAKSGTDAGELTDRVRALLPAEGAEATSGEDLAAEQSAGVAEATGSLTKALLGFAGIALFIGAFIIANTFTMLIAQRSREIALMRAVGASRRQVVRSVLVEATLLGLGASVAGFVLGLGIATALRPLINLTGAGLPAGPLVISPMAFAGSIVVGVVITVLAAWLPSRKAAKIAPVAALSSTDQAPPARALIVRHVVGILLTGAGMLVMLYVSTLRNTLQSSLMIAMLGSALTLLGLIVLAPLLSRPLIALAGKVTSRLFGVTGKLAKENALRNPRRTAATASALMIGLALVTGLTVVGKSAQSALVAEANQGMTADYNVSNSTPAGLDPSAATRIARLPGVAAAVPTTTALLDTNHGLVSVTGTDPTTYGKTAKLDFRSGSLRDIGPGKIAVSDEFAAKAGIEVGSTLKAGSLDGSEPQRKKKLTVVGVYAKTPTTDKALGTLTDVLPYSDTHKLENVLVKVEPGKTDGLERKIRAALGDSPLMEVQSHEQVINDGGGGVNMVLKMMYGLLGMAVLISVLGVVNTLAMSVFERTREIGMLRAIGLDRTGIKQMVRLESVVISVFGAVLGIGTGIFLAWAGSTMASSSLTLYETVLPWGDLAVLLGLALLIGVLAAIWPARRAARLNMLQSIQSS